MSAAIHRFCTGALVLLTAGMLLLFSEMVEMRDRLKVQYAPVLQSDCASLARQQRGERP